MKGIIDRFEGDLVVVELENGDYEEYERSLFPQEAEAGDSVQKEEEHFIILKEETDIRRRKIEKLMGDVWE